MSSTARDIDCGAPDMVSADFAQDLMQKNTHLERALKSARARNAQLWRALNEQQGRTVCIVGVYGRGETVERIVQAAQMSEEWGRIPVIRYLRDREGQINGLEMAHVERPAPSGDEHDPAFRMMAQLALGMAVVSGEDS